MKQYKIGLAECKLTIFCVGQREKKKFTEILLVVFNIYFIAFLFFDIFLSLNDRKLHTQLSRVQLDVKCLCKKM